MRISQFVPIFLLFSACADIDLLASRSTVVAVRTMFADGEAVTLESVVITGVFEGGIFVQDSGGGAGHGIAVATTDVSEKHPMHVGDVINITGTLFKTDFQQSLEHPVVLLRATAVADTGLDEFPAVTDISPLTLLESPEEWDGTLVRLVDTNALVATADAGDLAVSGIPIGHWWSDAIDIDTVAIGDTWTSITGIVYADLFDDILIPRVADDVYDYRRAPTE